MPDIQPGTSTTQRWLGLLALIVAAEAVFSLPFHLVRFFRPTLLSALEVSNTEIGAAQGLYGIVAFGAYFLGGPLADRYSPRLLLTLSLLSTAAGGLYFATLPSARGLYAVFAFWGVSTILLFWSPLIKATRQWGGDGSQGHAFGWLDGGRGLFAALLATGAAAVLAALLPEGSSDMSLEQQRAALRQVILIYVATTVAAAGLVALCVPAAADPDPDDVVHGHWRSRMGSVLREPALLPMLLIVLCAYVGYKGMDNYVLYAVQGYGYTDVQAAQVSAWGSWMRPVAALTAGYLADRYGGARIVAASFAILLPSHAIFILVEPSPDLSWVFFGNLLLTGAGVYALRGIYFALVAEARIPLAITGTAVGIISVLGFTPDIFVSPTMGFLLDRYPPEDAHRMIFALLSVFAFTGLGASLLFIRRSGSRLSRPIEPAG